MIDIIVPVMLLGGSLSLIVFAIVTTVKMRNQVKDIIDCLKQIDRKLEQVEQKVGQDDNN